MMVAYDRDADRFLNEEEAEVAADNPGIYSWVTWVPMNGDNHV